MSSHISFETRVIPTRNGRFEAAFCYGDVWHMVGEFDTARDAEIQALLGFQRFIRRLH